MSRLKYRLPYIHLQTKQKFQTKYLNIDDFTLTQTISDDIKHVK